MSKQEVENNSVGIQAKEVYLNISKDAITREEIKDICKSIFFDNFTKLQYEAKLTVDSRIQEFCNNFCIRLAQMDLLKTEKFTNPDIQYILYEAQKAYVRTDDIKKHDLIIDLISNRLNCAENTNMQLNINEAISMISKLNATHINILTFIHILTYTKSEILSNSRLPKDKDIIKKYFEMYVMPFVPSNITRTDLEYMSYCGCGTSLIGEPLQKSLLKNYPELFDGKEEKWGEKVEILVDNRYIDLKEYIISLNSDFRKIFEIYNDKGLCHYHLTSVSKMIAIYNYNRIANDNMNMSLWIN